MTKKLMSKIIITLATIFIGINSANAASCTYQQKAELNEIASKIKTSYEVVERIEKVTVANPDEDEFVTVERKIPEFKISIYNIVDDVYLTQTDSVTKTTQNIYFNTATNGIYTFIATDLDNITTYTYKVLANVDGCKGENLRSYTFVKPMANPYASFTICKDLQDVPYCKPYVTSPVNMDLNSLDKAINDYLKDEDAMPPSGEDDKTFLKIIKENYIYIIIGVVLVSGAISGTVYVVKKRSALK